MIAYLDSSILLRLALNQPQPFATFSSIRQAISSRLIRAECFRTLDRLCAVEVLSEEDQSNAMSFLLKAMDYIEMIPVDDILDNVGRPIGLNLTTLDAIHLFSALKWKEAKKKNLTFLTHDQQLAFAAKRFGFEVLGTKDKG